MKGQQNFIIYDVFITNCEIRKRVRNLAKLKLNSKKIGNDLLVTFYLLYPKKHINASSAKTIISKNIYLD